MTPARFLARGMIGAWLVCLAGSGCSQIAPPPAGSPDGLCRLAPGRTLRCSSSDPDWRNGNHDARPIKPGETLTLADIEGPGIIRHLWFTINAEDPRYGRSLTLRMYWDGASEPAVESPIGDFFAVGHGLKRYVDSLPVSVTSEGRAMNCYWPMPFAKRARLTLTNDSKLHRARSVYFYVDYEKVPSLPADTPYFHAQYRQEFPARMGQNYLLLDTEGRGHYVGTVLSVYSRTQGWFGEGDDFFFIDGEAEPSLRGTGTEDYFCDAWGFREFNRPYYGVVVFDGFETGDRVSVYRWHLADPVRFSKSLKVEIEHKGVMYDDRGRNLGGFTERADLFSSVAFWYQTGRAKRFATLPPAEERVVPQAAIECEDLTGSVRATPAGVAIEARRGAGGGRQLLAKVDDPGGTVTIPFKLAAAVLGVARLSLGAMPEGGIWSVAIDGKAIEALTMVDLHAATPAQKEVRVGMIDLAAGEHTLSFACRGRSPAARSCWLAVDALTIDAITPYAVPAASP